MTTMIAQQDMAIGITVKNTFIDLKKSTEVPARRSSSVPPAFKPTCSDWSYSDDSTNASDKGSPDNLLANSSDSEQGLPDFCSECTDDCDEFLYRRMESLDDCMPEVASVNLQSKVKLSLDDMVTEDAPKMRTKLRSQSRPFKSMRAPPAEVTTVITKAVKMMASGNGIFDVQVQDGGMGGTTMVVAECSGSNPDVSMTFALVKDALLNAAEQSENTYILGYGGQPFKNLGPFSFSANIACVPEAHRQTACWGTYEKGFCPRCATCRWDHPSEADMMRIIFMVKSNA